MRLASTDVPLLLMIFRPLSTPHMCKLRRSSGLQHDLQLQFSTSSAQSPVSGMKIAVGVLKGTNIAEVFAHLLKPVNALLVHVLGCPVFQLLFECQRFHLPEIVVEVWLLHGRNRR
jgi:hypothetical protein